VEGFSCHNLLVRQKAKEPEHREAAEGNVASSMEPYQAAAAPMVLVTITRHRHPDVDINQI
jgi:hypothetical protein